LQEEDEGTVTTGEGRCVRLRNSVSPPENARVDWKIICELAELLGKEKFFKYKNAGRFSRSLPRHERRTDRLQRMTYEKIENNMASSGVSGP